MKDLFEAALAIQSVRIFVLCNYVIVVLLLSILDIKNKLE